MALLGDLALLLSSDITPGSRIILHRDVIGRLTTLAGFIRWDPATAAVVAGGRVVFLADGYTTSSSYPQAESVRLAGGWVNYARASVVATVDAFSGDAHLYLSDHGDPIARAWAAVFPGLFQPMSEFPSELRADLRYPPALFDAQAGLYQRFHAQSPGAFASGAGGVSSSPGLPSGLRPMVPEELVSIRRFTPRARAASASARVPRTLIASSFGQWLPLP